jgi:biotin operon repressor
MSTADSTKPPRSRELTRMIWRRELRVPMGQKAVLTSIMDHADANDYAYPSLDLIAEELTISRTQAWRFVEGLVKAGVITKSKRDTGHGHYAGNGYHVNVRNGPFPSGGNGPFPSGGKPSLSSQEETKVLHSEGFTSEDQNQSATEVEDDLVAHNPSTVETQEPGKIEDSEQDQDLLKSCAKKGSDAKPCAYSLEPIAPTHPTPRRVFDHTKAWIAYHGHGEDPTPWTHDMTVQVCHVLKKLELADFDFWDKAVPVLHDWKTFRSYMKSQVSKAELKKVRPTTHFLFWNFQYLYGFCDLPAYQLNALRDTGKPYVSKADIAYKADMVAYKAKKKAKAAA